MREILRLIINLVPSNELQEHLEGDLRTLPHFGMWSALELMEQELFVWSGDDISCAFYIFGLPPAWLPWFVLDWPLEPSLWGGEGTTPEHLALAVIPMGWCNAVAICQSNLRTLVMSDPPKGGGLPARFELRKE